MVAEVCMPGCVSQTDAALAARTIRLTNNILKRRFDTPSVYQKDARVGAFFMGLFLGFGIDSDALGFGQFFEWYSDLQYAFGEAGFYPVFVSLLGQTNTPVKAA